ncbi:MAG: phosphoadenylyl-sulfate reductase [Gemmatimonadaceae bacterium]
MSSPATHPVQLPVLGSNVPTGRTPDEIVQWTLARFATWRIGITTAFGMEGCALVDMIARTGVPLRVAYIDTHFLFPETLALRDRMVRRYPDLTFLNIGVDYTEEAQALEHGPRLWERNPDLCCRLRKVDPMRTWLGGHDVWITAIRRGQSVERASVPVVGWDDTYDLVKVSPMAGWTRQDVWDYISRNGVPYNTLHERGYPSIGCTHCTTAVPGATVTSYSRDGRWAGQGKAECGLHVPGGATA